MNFSQKSENVMHELVPHNQMLQDSLHSFLFRMLMQKQFLKVTEKDPFLSISYSTLLSQAEVKQLIN